jgi:hypothetical protein
MARRRPTDTTANPARGAILVVAAVLVGLFLLRHGLDTSTTTTSTGSDQGTDVGTDSGTDAGTDTGTDSSTSSTLGVRDPLDVKTIVLNGSGVKGAAKKWSTFLANKGYTLTNPDGDNSIPKPATTQVLYGPGYDKEAAAMAVLLGAPAAGVQALGTTLPGNTVGASVIVVLGTDLGAKDPPA